MVIRNTQQKTAKHTVHDCAWSAAVTGGDGVKPDSLNLLQSCVSADFATCFSKLYFKNASKDELYSVRHINRATATTKNHTQLIKYMCIHLTSTRIELSRPRNIKHLQFPKVCHNIYIKNPNEVGRNLIHMLSVHYKGKLPWIFEASTKNTEGRWVNEKRLTCVKKQSET